MLFNLKQIEITRVNYSAFFAIAPHPQQSCVWRFRILRVYQKSMKWTWVEPFEMNGKIERGSNFVVDNESRFFDAQEA